MKRNTPQLLCILSSGLGCLCLFARVWYLSSAVDYKGLLVPHAGNIISWILTAAAILSCLLLVLLRKPKITFEHAALTYGSTAAYALALGSVAGQLLTAGSLLNMIGGILALVSALCAVLQLVYRLSGKSVPGLCRFPLIAFFLIYLLCAYQQWSTQPQTTLYVFQLLALVCLAVHAYHRAALTMHMGSHSIYLICLGLAVFFCLAAVPGDSNWMFYLFMAPAVMLDVCVETGYQEG